MAKPPTSQCIIEILLERPERAYKPGERIKGSVEILPGADMKCRKVTLTARWAARGKGPEDAAEVETIAFPGGAWRNNQKVSHTFDFPAPQLPLSYEGEAFDIRWYLTATADLPATKDASAVVKVHLVHGGAVESSLPFNVTDSYNPFAALGGDTAQPSRARYRPPSFYTAMGVVPVLVILPVLAGIVLYFIGVGEQEYEPDYVTDVLWSALILGTLFILAMLFRRRMRAKRREALNRHQVSALEPGARMPRLPGKFWEKGPPDDSQRGWPRSITSLTFAAVGLLLMAVGLIYVSVQPWGPKSAAALASSLLGFLLVMGAKGGVRPSWRFIKTYLALGRVEVGLTPEKLRCGDELRVYVDFRTSLPAQVTEARATLEAYEVVEDYYKNMPTMDVDIIAEKFKAQRQQRTKYRFARVNRIHSQDVMMAAGRTLLPQESANLSGKIAVPAEAPPTFLAVGNKILWFMVVRVKLASGVQWSTDIPILLQP